MSKLPEVIEEGPAITAREKFLSDIIITAVEGGIGYWATVTGYHHTPPPANVRVREEEEEGKPWIAVDIARIDRAIKKIIASADGKSVGIHERYVKLIAGVAATNDGGDIDADLADIIMQVAVLGKVIYG